MPEIINLLARPLEKFLLPRQIVQSQGKPFQAVGYGFGQREFAEHQLSQKIAGLAQLGGRRLVLPADGMRWVVEIELELGGHGSVWLDGLRFPGFRLFGFASRFGGGIFSVFLKVFGELVKKQLPLDGLRFGDFGEGRDVGYHGIELGAVAQCWA